MIKRTSKNSNPSTMDASLSLLVVVVPDGKGEYYTDILKEYEVNLSMQLHGRGTASSQMMALLGLTHDEKSVLLSIIRKDQIAPAMQELDTRFSKAKRANKGIAYTIPLSGVIGVAVYGFLANQHPEEEI